MSEYKDQIDKMRWSYSRLSNFDTCKYCFYLNYIIGDNEEYLSEGNFYAEVGSFMHEILAMIFNKQLDPKKSFQYFKKNFKKNIFYKVKQSTMKKTYELCADYLKNEDFSWISNYEVLGVEKEIDFKLGKYLFVGIIDLLLRDKRDGKIIVLDHKSMQYPFKVDGGVKKNCEKNFNHYKMQMYLYCHAIKELYGEFPKEITWNHFKEQGKFATIPFNEAEYEDTIKWFMSTVEEIETEEDFEPTLDYFFCKNLCNFRASCEYCAMADWK